MNDSGVIVGTASDAAGHGLAFVYQGGTMWDVNRWVDFSTGFHLTGAMDINNNGEILCRGVVDGVGVGHAFLVEPMGGLEVPEPGITALGAATIAFLSATSRRRRA